MPGTYNNSRYVCNDDTRSGYVGPPDSLGSMFGIFVLSLSVVVAMVVEVLVLPELSPSVVSFPFSPIYPSIVIGYMLFGWRG